MDTRVQIVAIVATAGLFVVLLDLVRRRRMLERYAIVWLFCAFALLGLSVWKGLLTELAHAVGIFYAPSALFVIAFGFVLVLLLHFSIAVSNLAEQNKVLAQRLALLEERQRQGGAQRGSRFAEPGAEEPVDGDQVEVAEPVPK
jgi:hypothetical protein